jgi:Fe-S cluster assembly iron-binding protein IscA
MSKDTNPNLALRIQVESGGCHGFQYLMSLTTLPPLSESPPALNASSGDPNAMPSGSQTENLNPLEEGDTVFEAEDGSGARVVMDGPSLDLLKGSKVDFTMELIGSQFKIVDNPLATSSCGCGTSFDIKA